MSEIKLQYKIQYKILGRTEDFESPPYPEEEIESQKNDIAGYEGVYNARIVPVHPERQESPCRVCQRPNDLDVKKCWNCEVANPTQGSK